MNTSTDLRFNLRTILRIIVIIGVGFALTAAALRTVAQEIQPGIVADETSAYTVAANFDAHVWIVRVPIRFLAQRAVETTLRVLGPSAAGILPAGDSVGVASSQSGFNQNP